MRHVEKRADSQWNSDNAEDERAPVSGKRLQQYERSRVESDSISGGGVSSPRARRVHTTDQHGSTRNSSCLNHGAAPRISTVAIVYQKL